MVSLTKTKPYRLFLATLLLMFVLGGCGGKDKPYTLNVQILLNHEAGSGVANVMLKGSNNQTLATTNDSGLAVLKDLHGAVTLVPVKAGFIFTPEQLTIEQAQLVTFIAQAVNLQSTVEPTTASFDKNRTKQADLTVNLTLNGNTFETIKFGDTLLRSGLDYVLQASTLTLKKEFLATLPVTRSVKLLFLFSAGEPVVFSITVTDTTPHFGWKKSFGGSGDDYAYKVKQTKDSGFIMVGTTTSFDLGNEDIYVIKVDANGNKEWAKPFGTEAPEHAWDVQETDDGGFLVLGQTSVNTLNDIYLLKIDSSGNPEYDSVIPGDYAIIPRVMKATADGGWIIAGRRVLEDSEEGYLVKLSALLLPEWTAGVGYACAHNELVDVAETTDGGYILTGSTGNDETTSDILLVKVTSGGKLDWQTRFGQQNNSKGCAVIAVDNSFLIGGTAGPRTFGATDYDAFALKTDSQGNILWAKTYGATATEFAYDMVDTGDGYVLAGMTSSYGPNKDIYLAKLDYSGTQVWAKNIPGTNDEYGYSLEKTTDGGLIIAGSNYLPSTHQGDAYLVKTDANGGLD